MQENAHLFYQFKSIAPSGTVTQDDIREITEELQEDSRYKALDRLDNERRLLLLQHLGFVHCPIREHCPAHPSCMDAVVERLISTRAHRPASWNRHSQWLLGSSTIGSVGSGGSGVGGRLSLILLGISGLAQELMTEMRALCEDNEYEMEGQHYRLEYRVIDGDVNEPHNAFRTTNFTPQGCFCIFSDADSFEYVRDSLEKTLLANLEHEDRLPFQGLPIVIVMAAEPSLTEDDFERLKGEGLNLAENLQCPFIELSLSPSASSLSAVTASATDDGPAPVNSGSSNNERTSPPSSDEVSRSRSHRFSSLLVSNALRALVTSIQQRAGLLSICMTSGIGSGSGLALDNNTLSMGGSMATGVQPDIRIILAMLCADPFSVESVLGPLLTHQCCFVSGQRSLTLETFLGDSKRRVEVVVTSYHSADSFR